MDIWQPEKLVLFLAYLLPGFISVKIYDLIIPTEKRDFSKSIFEVVAYSALNFAALSWLIILIQSGNFRRVHEFWYLVWVFFIMFAMPVFWPIIGLKLLSWGPIAKRVLNPIQKPWDFVFGKRHPFWVIVHLHDGSSIGGRYDQNSFASSFPSEEEIYLEEVWELNKEGAFEKPIDRSGGIIILNKDISSIEFFT